MVESLGIGSLMDLGREGGAICRGSSILRGSHAVSHVGGEWGRRNE